MFLLQVNDMDMAGVTREEAVLYLLSLQDQIDLIGENNPQSRDNLQPLIPSIQYPQLRIMRLKVALAVGQNIWRSFLFVTPDPLDEDPSFRRPFR
jgi:hypothetical protein